MMCMQPEGLWRRFVELEFDRERRLAARQTSAVADAENVRVDREGLGPKGDVHHDIGGLATDTGQGFERVAVGGNLAAINVDQALRQGDHVLGLGVEQADRLDMLFQSVLAERNHLRGRFDLFEQPPRRLVDADIGGLRRQGDRDDQLEGVARFQLGFRMGIVRRQPGIKFDDVGFFQTPSTWSML